MLVTASGARWWRLKYRVGGKEKLLSLGELAHGEQDEVRAVYHYAQHLPERRKMRQSWSNYLDGLRAGSNVVPLRKSA